MYCRYFPANATLYIVGDLDRDAEATVQLIQKTFGHLTPKREWPEGAAPAEGAANGHANGANGNGGSLAPIKQRHAVRPPVVHKHGCVLRTGDHGPWGLLLFSL